MKNPSEDLDHYAVLQISPRAEPEVIEAAYSALSAKHQAGKGSAANKNIRQLTKYIVKLPV